MASDQELGLAVDNVKRTVADAVYVLNAAKAALRPTHPDTLRCDAELVLQHCTNVVEAYATALALLNETIVGVQPTNQEEKER